MRYVCVFGSNVTCCKRLIVADVIVVIWKKEYVMHLVRFFFLFFWGPYDIHMMPNRTHMCYVCGSRCLGGLGRGGRCFVRPSGTLHNLYKSCQNVWVY